MVFGRLTIVYPDGRQTTLTLDKPTVRIGSAPDNTIVLSDPVVDPYHAQILCDSNGCQILDLNSTSGTIVNGRRLAGQQIYNLSDGSVIQIGGSRITIRLSTNIGGSATTSQLSPATHDNDLLGNLLGTPVPGTKQTRSTPKFGTPRPVTATPSNPEAPTIAVPTVAPSQLHLSISQDDLELEAGATVMITVSVVNNAKIVDRVEIVVEGLPAAWVKVVPPQHSLMPAAKSECQIVITPPRAPTSTAKRHKFKLSAKSEERPADQASIDAALTILPFSEFRFDQLNPKEQTAWIQTSYEMMVINRGNQDQSYEFLGVNDQDYFVFQTSPATFIVAPGTTARTRLLARLRFVRWFGKLQTHQFMVNATPTDGSAATQQVVGRFVQKPPLPPWLLLLLLALLLLSLFGCIGYIGYLNRCRVLDCATAVPTVLPISPLPILPTTSASPELPPTAAPMPTPDIQATLGIEKENQAATAAALQAGFNQTATALVNANAETQEAFSISVMQTQTAVANGFAQTQTAGAISINQTQTAFAVADNATATAQANLNLTATANMTAQQQTQTAQVFADVTLTALATAAQQTQTALALTPLVNPGTLTAITSQFIQTQTAQSVQATQTAQAITPTATPTSTPTPTATLTPTATPLADIVVRFSTAVRAPIRGDTFAAQNVIFCFYHDLDSDFFTGLAVGEPECNPRNLNVQTSFGDVDGSEVQPAQTISGFRQDLPFLYPAGLGSNGPEGVLTSEYAPCTQPPGYGCSNQSGSVRDAILVINFPQRSVANVTLRFWLPAFPANEESGVTYFLTAYDSEGNQVANANTGQLSVPAFYPLTVQSPSGRIQQVQLSQSRNNEFTGLPVFVTTISANYNPR